MALFRTMNGSSGGGLGTPEIVIRTLDQSATVTFTKDYKMVVLCLTSGIDRRSLMKINGKSPDHSDFYASTSTNVAIWENVKSGESMAALGTGGTYNTVFVNIT